MSRLDRVYVPVWPYRPFEVKPGILRRLGLRRTPFATIDELSRTYPARRNLAGVSDRRRTRKT